MHGLRGGAAKREEEEEEEKVGEKEKRKHGSQCHACKYPAVCCELCM